MDDAVTFLCLVQDTRAGAKNLFFDAKFALHEMHPATNMLCTLHDLLTFDPAAGTRKRDFSMKKSEVQKHIMPWKVPG
jgi:hypothetical protein